MVPKIFFDQIFWRRNKIELTVDYVPMIRSVFTTISKCMKSQIVPKVPHFSFRCVQFCYVNNECLNVMQKAARQKTKMMFLATTMRTMMTRLAPDRDGFPSSKYPTKWNRFHSQAHYSYSRRPIGQTVFPHAHAYRERERERYNGVTFL